MSGHPFDTIVYSNIPLGYETPAWRGDLPWPPSNNHYYTVVRGRKILSKAGREYAEGAVPACAGQNRPVRPLSGRLRVEVAVCPPDRRRRDLDNLGKPVLDALVKGRVIEDDGLIDDLRFIRAAVLPGGAVMVKVWTL